MLSDAQRDAIVKKMKSHIEDLEGEEAELLALSTAFDVMTTMCLFRGFTRKQTEAHIANAYQAYLRNNEPGKWGDGVEPKHN